LIPEYAEKMIQFVRTQNGGSTPTKINSGKDDFGELFFSDDNFLVECRQEVIFQPQRGRKMKITVVTRLSAKRYVQIDASHIREGRAKSGRRWFGYNKRDSFQMGDLRK
jgi:hypothetical protein